MDATAVKFVPGSLGKNVMIEIKFVICIEICSVITQFQKAEILASAKVRISLDIEFYSYQNNVKSLNLL